MMDELKNELYKMLEQVGQSHLLKYWDSLNDAQKEHLASQIKAIDWPRVLEWLHTAEGGISKESLARLVPAPYKPAVPTSQEDKALYVQAREKGEAMLAAGQVAAFTVAGGQGTRLGYDGPKGTYPVTQLKHKSLFQVFAEGILRTQKKYGTCIPWYIMTSIINDSATRAFFKENAYFGLKAEQIMFFSQGMLPAFDLATGKALLEAPDSLALSPNGHGGSFEALRSSGALDDMAAKGISTISYWQVDNPLIKQFDTLFLGLHNLLGSDMSSKALLKRDAKEKLGHFCLLDGRLTIIEYSDMPDELLYKTDETGLLAFRAGSPAIHTISRSFIERLTATKLELQPHKASKKVKHLNENGELVSPDKPNAVKLEFFLFDALPLASNPLILEGNRQDEFAPVKNAEGDDSPESSRRYMLDKAVRMLRQAGVNVPLKADGSPDAVIELSPAIFGDADDVKANIAMIPEIKPGSELYIG